LILLRATTPAKYRDELQIFRFKVNFSAPFGTPPGVHPGLTSLILTNATPPAMSLIAAEITKTGPTAVLSTWRGTCVYSIAFSWLAVGD